MGLHDLRRTISIIPQARCRRRCRRRHSFRSSRRRTATAAVVAVVVLLSALKWNLVFWVVAVVKSSARGWGADLIWCVCVCLCEVWGWVCWLQAPGSALTTTI